MKRINILDKETCNKIAAGEVVERASSVVKELVENSIDAGSKNIVIEVEDSGNRLIRISDDGSGIHKDDIEKAFLPHATSKIQEIEDIYKINSFGFRGEALASISSISRVNLKSKTASEDFGKEIIIEGGEIKDIVDAACNDGTTIEVRDLFYNVPARQKFLKSPQRESSLISDLVLRLALGNYGVSFKLTNNGKKTVSTYGSENLEDAIHILYGKEVSKNIVPFETHSDILSVYGFIGNSEISRGSRNRQSIFVNKRLIKSSTITAAVENAFKSFLTVNKFPFFVLFLDIFPEYIDPNVHPTKAEIKFYDERSIFKFIFDSVHSALRNYMKENFSFTEDGVIEFKKEEETKFKQEVLHDDFLEKKIDIQYVPIDLKSDSTIGKEEKASYKVENDNKIFEKIQVKDAVWENEDKSKEEIITKEKEKLSLEKEEVVKKTENKEIVPKFGYVKIIGQFNNTYIIAECNNELILIDQHAAHEKYMFEKYKKSIESFEVISQVLLTPIVIELSFDEAPYYEENKDVFKKAGFNIEDFGNNTISIREVPMFLGKPDVKSLFYDILENLKNMGNGSTVEVKYNKIASLACKAAVKANNKLSQIEMEKLIDDLRYMDDPFTCPHGRPTMIKMTLNEIEKKFKRIQ
ncbi:DNA mismatch repair endonuclease MutL [Clostridium ihumii]|uniref:DNA mismatch repair endonuclease MutL n=1 Tax=Clostridium ihumii TaxID=1470356 RepID=UPI00055056D9|nr:DNA mismatch repair endonuclease MutL [Clostridium ihumii]